MSSLFLIYHEENLFVKGKNCVINNAMGLLNTIGYINLVPLWVHEW